MNELGCVSTDEAGSEILSSSFGRVSLELYVGISLDVVTYRYSTASRKKSFPSCFSTLQSILFA